MDELIKELIPLVGKPLAEKMAKELRELSDENDSLTTKLALTLLAEAVESEGEKGILLAYNAIESLFEKKSVDLDWASARTSSDAVAMLQNASAEQKSTTRKFLVQLGVILGSVGVGIIKSL